MCGTPVLMKDSAEDQEMFLFSPTGSFRGDGVHTADPSGGQGSNISSDGGKKSPFQTQAGTHHLHSD